jgi:hypothetical protein
LNEKDALPLFDPFAIPRNFKEKFISGIVSYITCDLASLSL